MNQHKPTEVARVGRIARLTGWLRREVGAAALCSLAVYLGVLSSAALPAALLAALPLPASLQAAGLIISPLAALPLAGRVFDTRAWPRWRLAGRAPLGVRLLRAYSDGVLWLNWWRHRQGSG